MHETQKMIIEENSLSKSENSNREQIVSHELWTGVFACIKADFRFVHYMNMNPILKKKMPVYKQVQTRVQHQILFWSR